MNAQEAVDEKVWSVLLKIKEQDILSDWTDLGIINFGYASKEEEKILIWLQDEKVIELQNLSRNLRPGIISVAGDSSAFKEIKLKLVQPAYDKLYEEYESLSNATEQAPVYTSNKLIFYPEDGIAQYKGEEYQFKGKGKAILTLLHGSKNTPYSIEDVKAKCNPAIANSSHKFKADKDIWDTVALIRRKLKVNKGEYFPIQKHESNWIWLEKTES